MYFNTSEVERAKRIIDGYNAIVSWFIDFGGTARQRYYIVQGDTVTEISIIDLNLLANRLPNRPDEYIYYSFIGGIETTVIDVSDWMNISEHIFPPLFFVNLAVPSRIHSLIELRMINNIKDVIIDTCLESGGKTIRVVLDERRFGSRLTLAYIEMRIDKNEVPQAFKFTMHNFMPRERWTSVEITEVTFNATGQDVQITLPEIVSQFIITP